MNIAVFGARGSIGSYICEKMKLLGTLYALSHDTLDMTSLPELDVVVWAHGFNTNDRIGECMNTFDDVMDVNVSFTVKTLDNLVASNRLRSGARLCIISSIWQNNARSNKFSYTVSKAAVGGIVRAAAADLHHLNIYVNAILPGPVDNQMTRKTLTQSQIENLPGLVTCEDIWNAVYLLCFNNLSIQAQSIVIDHGMSVFVHMN